MVRRYVSIDGGMSDNIRTALYDADYTVVLASRSSDAPGVLSRVVGKHCESGDIVVRDCYLPSDLAVGDLVAVAATGAYCYAMASNYNRLPRPAGGRGGGRTFAAAAAPRDRRRPDASWRRGDRPEPDRATPDGRRMPSSGQPPSLVPGVVLLGAGRRC